MNAHINQKGFNRLSIRGGLCLSSSLSFCTYLAVSLLELTNESRRSKRVRREREWKGEVGGGRGREGQRGVRRGKEGYHSNLPWFTTKPFWQFNLRGATSPGSVERATLRRDALKHGKIGQNWRFVMLKRLAEMRIERWNRKWNNKKIEERAEKEETEKRERKDSQGENAPIKRSCFGSSNKPRTGWQNDNIAGGISSRGTSKPANKFQSSITEFIRVIYNIKVIRAIRAAG